MILLLCFGGRSMLAGAFRNLGYLLWIRQIDATASKPAYFRSLPDSAVRGRWDQANAVLPENQAAFRTKAWMLLGEGENGRALAAWKSGGGTAVYLAAQGQTAARGGYISEAVQWYQSALEWSPDQQEALFGLGVVYYESKRWHEALAALDRSASVAGPVAIGTIHYYLGLVLLNGEASDTNRSGQEFRRALASGQFQDGTHRLWSYYFLSEVLRKTGDLEGAIREAEIAFGLYPSDYDTVCHLGVLYREAGNMTRAEEMLLKAMGINQKRPQAARILGLIYQQSGQIDQAIQMLERVRALDSSDQSIIALLSELKTKHR